MIKHKRFFRRVLLIALLLIFGGTQALADKNPVGFFVKPLLPMNQMNPDVSFFSLHTAPDQEQTLEVLVVNETDDEIEIAIEVNKAFTNANGVIEYTAREKTDMETEWTEWIVIEEPLLVVKAHETAVARFHLSLPEEPFEGDLLGGILFTRVADKEEKPSEEQNSAIQIQNVFIYCVAIQIAQRDDQAEIQPEFAITDARMDTIAGFPALILEAENKQPVIVLGATLEAAVYPEDGGEAVLAYEKELSMAPDTSASLSKLLTDGDKVQPGTYRVEAEITFKEKSWRFELPLTVE